MCFIGEENKVTFDYLINYQYHFVKIWKQGIQHNYNLSHFDILFHC